MQSFHTTPSQENYIEWIYRLSLRGPVRAAQLADKLGIQRSSVTRSVGVLVEKGLVIHESHREISLTESGHRLGQAIVRRDECLTRLLVEVLAVSPEQADPEVHRLEHVISEDLLLRLETLVSFATSSPAWVKRLNHRIQNALASQTNATGIQVGCSPVHPGYSCEKDQSDHQQSLGKASR